MIAFKQIALSPDTPPIAASRNFGSTILAYCVALPLFGRAVFPMARDKAHITLASSFTDPQILGTYLVAAVVMFKFFTAKSFPSPVNSRRPARVFMLFVAVCLTSTLGSRFLLFSLWRSFEVFLLGVWALVMIRNTVGAGVAPSKAIGAFYAICVAILIGVIVGLVINPNGAWNMEGDVARLTGTTGYSINSNDIGAIAALVSIACYVRTIERGSLLYGVTTAVFIAICYVARSRGGYFALTVGFLAATLMLGRLARRRATVLLVSLAVALTVGAAAFLSQEFRSFFTFLLTRGHESQDNLDSFGGRLHVWEFGLQVFKEHPFLGTGYGTYPEGVEGGHFHNVFIELLVTTGVIGAVCYVAFLTTMLGATRRWIRQSNTHDIAQRITAADLVTIPAVIIVANGASAGAAYYSWDLLGLVSVAVASSSLLVTRPTITEQCPAAVQFANLLR